MMSDEDDFDYTTTNRRFLKKKMNLHVLFVLHFSSGNLATIFHGGESASTAPAATTAYVPPKQPKKGILHQRKTDHMTFFFYLRFRTKGHDRNTCSNIFIVNLIL